MSTLLWNTIVVPPIPSLGTLVVPHGIVDDGVPTAPNFVYPDRGTGLVVTAVTDTDVTFLNSAGGDSAEMTFLCELTFSTQRNPAAPTEFFYQGGGGSSAGGTITNVVAGVGLTGGGPGPVVNLAVDQGFSPTWTGTHTFSNTIRAPGVDTAAAGALAIGATNATSIVLGHGTISVLPAVDDALGFGSGAFRWGALNVSGTADGGLNVIETAGVTQRKLFIDFDGTNARILTTTAAGAIPNLTVDAAGVLHLGDLTSTAVQIASSTTNLGFFDATPEPQVTVPRLTNNVTAGGVNNVIADYTIVDYATDAAAIRNNLYQLARKLREVVEGLTPTSGCGLFDDGE